MSASSSRTTSVDISSFAAAMQASSDLSRRPSVSSRSKTAVRAPEPSSRTAFTRRSGSPLTSPWRRQAPFLRTRRHSGQRYTRPEPSRRSIKMPRTVTSAAPPRSARSSIHIRGLTLSRADRRRLADVRLARAGLEFRQGGRRFLRDRGPDAEVDLDLPAVFLRVRVLHADHVPLGERDRKRLPRGEGDCRRRIAEDAVQDALRAAFDGHVPLVHAHDPGKQVDALLPGHEFPQGLADPRREGRGVPAVLLDDRPLRGVQRHAIDVQVARQLSLDLLLTHFVPKRPGDVMDMGRQLLFHRTHVPEACLFLASSLRTIPSYKGVRTGGRKYWRRRSVRKVHSLSSVSFDRGHRRDDAGRPRVPPDGAGARPDQGTAPWGDGLSR